MTSTSSASRVTTAADAARRRGEGHAAGSARAKAANTIQAAGRCAASSALLNAQPSTTPRAGNSASTTATLMTSASGSHRESREERSIGTESKDDGER